MLKLAQKGNIQLLLILLILAGISVGTYFARYKLNITPTTQNTSESAQPDTGFYLEAVFPNMGQIDMDQKRGVEDSSLSAALEDAKNLNLSEVLFPNQRFAVNLYVRSDIDEANLFAAKLIFPKELLEVQSIKKVPQLVENDYEDGLLICAGKNGIRCPTGYSCHLEKNLSEAEGKCVKNKQAESGRSEEDKTIKETSFVSFWAEETFNNDSGTVSLIGAVPNPGFKTGDKKRAYMATVIFKTKSAGNAKIDFGKDSSIYRNSDNSEILKTKNGIQLIVVDKPEPGSSQSPNINNPPSVQPSHGYKKGDANGDGRVDITDLSILLSLLGKSSAKYPALDFNGDGKINAFEFSQQLKLVITGK